MLGENRMHSAVAMLLCRALIYRMPSFLLLLVWNIRDFSHLFWLRLLFHTLTKVAPSVWKNKSCVISCHWCGLAIMIAWSSNANCDSPDCPSILQTFMGIVWVISRHPMPNLPFNYLCFMDCPMSLWNLQMPLFANPPLTLLCPCVHRFVIRLNQHHFLPDIGRMAQVRAHPK